MSRNAYMPFINSFAISLAIFVFAQLAFRILPNSAAWIISAVCFLCLVLHYLVNAPKWLFKLRVQNTIKMRGIIASTLLDKRIILLDGSVTDTRCRKLFREFSYLNEQSAEPIYLYIDSNGGSANAMRLLMNAISTSKAPVIGMVIGNAFSAAAVLLQSCAKRLAMPYAMLLVHEGRISEGGLQNISLSNYTEGNLHELVDKLAIYSQAFHEDNALAKKAILDRSGLSAEQLERIYERRISAQEALRLGLIDGIVFKL